MSMIAAMLIQAVPAAPPAMTAEQAMAAHRAATSIGPDPCRPGADAGDEIVVCGRRESSYALPGYDPMAGSPESQAGGRRIEQTADVRRSQSDCARQGAFCQPPPAVNLFAVVPALIKGVRALIDGE